MIYILQKKKNRTSTSSSSFSTILKLISTPSSLFFIAIVTMFFSIGSHCGGGRRELGCREMKKQKKEI